MQDKIDESIQIIEELSKHNKSLTSQLAQESNKRKKIAQELQQIESEVSEKQSDPQRKSEKKISSATENLRKNLSDTEDGVFLNKTHEGLKNSTQHETEISEFDDIFKKLKGNDLKVNGIDMLYFLQCEAAALEDFLEAVEE